MTQPERADFVFRMADVFPPNDATARYVARLSIGLADLRLVAERLMRDELTDRKPRLLRPPDDGPHARGRPGAGAAGP
jgi:hypothetical protein